MEWLGWILFAVGLIALLVWEFMRGSQPRAPMAPPVTTTLDGKLHIAYDSNRDRLQVFDGGATAPQRISVQWTGTDGKTATADPTPQPPLRDVPRPSGGILQIKLVSNRGRALGAIPLPRVRKPVLRHRTKDGHLSVFVASHAEPSGDWVYRRVGVERES